MGGTGLSRGPKFRLNVTATLLAHDFGESIQAKPLAPGFASRTS
jgi:hypothetical protein